MHIHWETLLKVVYRRRRPDAQAGRQMGLAEKQRVSESASRGIKGRKQAALTPAHKNKRRAPSVSQVLSRNGWEAETIFTGRISSGKKLFPVPYSLLHAVS
jgi:hypothetical protein